MAEAAVQLCPGQKKALDRVLELWPCSDAFVLWSRAGMGRSTVLAELDRKLPLDLDAVADATDGFTGADLDRLAKDARALLIGELAAQRPVASLTSLFLEAVKEVRRNMEVIQSATAAAQARAATQMPNPFAFMNRYSGGEGESAPPSA